MVQDVRFARLVFVVGAITLGLIAQVPGGSTAKQANGPGPVFVVTNTEDYGDGSLRRALLDANAAPNRGGLPDRILFDLGGPTPQVIRLYAALPEITDPVVIDGRAIELDGSWLKEGDGLIVRCGGSTIRGLTIHGFPADAIRLVGEGGNVVEGNSLGGNGGHGIAIVDSARNRVGGTSAASQNEIEANGLSGVLVSGDAAIGNAILGNRIGDNGDLGIELEGEGDAAPDALDADLGPNRQQNAPILEKVSRLEGNPGDGTSARISGTIASAPKATFRLEFFSTVVTNPDAKSKRQGDTLLTSTDVTTNERGEVSFQVVLPRGVASRALVTATATDPEGNTSEFSDAVLAPAITKSWAAAASGGWNTGANWSPAGVPAATDDVVITIAGTYSVTLDVAATVASLTLGGASGAQTLLANANTLTLSGASTVNANGVLSQGGATITGAGTLTINGTYNWSGGQLQGTGLTTVNGPLNVSAVVGINGARTLVNAGTATWTGSSGQGIRMGNGSIISNTGTWDAQADVVVVNFYGGTAAFNNSGTFKKSAGTGTISMNVPFANTGTVDAQSGTISLGAGGSSTNALNVSGATATLLFAVGVFDLNAGTTFSGPGTILLNSSGTLNVNAPVSFPAGTTFTFLAGTLGGTGTVTVNGTLNWSGGLMTGAGITNVNGPFNLSGLTAISGSRTLNNNSTANWTSTSGNGMWTGTGSVINNNGTWDSQADEAYIVNHYGGATTFNNFGTFKKSAATGVSYMDIPFVNTGTVDVQSGTFSLRGGGSSTTALNVSGASSTLLFAAGTFNLNAGTTFSGPGTILLNSSGTVNANAPVAFPAGTTFTFLAGTLGGTGTVTVNGTLNWSGGLMTGAGITNVNGPFNLSGLTAISGSRTLNNNSTANWTSPSGQGIWTGTGSVINNTGTWDSSTDNVAIVNHYGGATTFNNSGTFKKSAGAGTSTISITFVNTGTLDVQTGTISLGLGCTNSNALKVSGASSTLLFAAGVDDLNAGTTFSGPGTVLLNSTGTLNANVPVTFPAGTTFTFLAGTLAGTGTLTTNGTFNWSGGLMTAAATTNVNGPFNISGLPGINNSRVLNNNNVATWTSGSSLGVWTGTGSVINNTGIWDSQTDNVAIVNHYGGATSFNNSGTLKKSAGTGTTSISIPLTNTGTVDVQSGTLNVSSSTYTQTAGITKLTGGALTSTTNIAIQGGSLAGTGTVTGPVIVSGTGALAPGLSAGLLTLAGNYTQSGAGTAFNVELGGTTPGTQFDRADVTGAAGATIAGNLNVSLINAFTPVANTDFTIMTYPSHTGTFVLNPPSVTCLGWRVNYGATSVVLSALPLPTELIGLGFLADKTVLQWDSAPAYAGTTYDLLRGGLNTLPVGPGAGESCLAQGISGTTATDTDVPALGQGFWYVVRERVTGCGIGSYGFATSGAERISTACP